MSPHLPVVLAAAMAAVFLLALVQPDGRLALPLDDAWIHLSYARTLAEHGRWALTAQAPASAGTTGWLWGGILAAMIRAGVAPALSAALAGASSFVVLVWAWSRLASRCELEVRFALLSAAALALCGNLLWISASGMESLALLALAVLAVERRAAGDRRALAAACAAAALARPEGLLVGVSIAAVEAWQARAGGIREVKARVSGALLATLAGMALHAALNVAATGSPAPATLSGRRWLANLPAQLSLTPGVLARHAADMTVEWWEHLRDFTFTLGATGFCGDESSDAKVLAEFLDARVAGLQIVLTLAGLAWLVTHAAWPLRPLVAYSLLHCAAYAVALPLNGHAGRYQPEVLLWAAVLPALGAAAAAGWMKRRFGGLSAPPEPSVSSEEDRSSRENPRRALSVDRLGPDDSGDSPSWHRASRLLAAVLAGLLVSWLGNASAWWSAAQRAGSHIEELHVRAALWVRENLPADARLAAFDIGAVAFHGRRELVDYSGLTDSEAAVALHARRLLAFLERRGATHLAMVSAPDSTLRMELARCGLNARPGEGPRPPKLRLLAEFTIPYSQLSHFAMTRIAFSCMRIYAIEW